jgi:hypothetical protein
VPSKDQHLGKAIGNERFAKSLALSEPPWIEWALTAMFYAAMHYIEAYLATRGQHPRSHVTRDGFVGREPNLKRIFIDYQELKTYGLNARYEMVAFKANDVTEHATRSLETIKAHIDSLL